MQDEIFKHIKENVDYGDYKIGTYSYAGVDGFYISIDSKFHPPEDMDREIETLWWDLEKRLNVIEEVDLKKYRK